MDDVVAAPSASRQPTTTLRLRDRLRALVNLNNVTRRGDNVALHPETSRFSISSMFFPRRVNANTPRPTVPAESQQVQDDSSTRPLSPINSPPPAVADTGNLLARLEALNDFFDEEHDTPPAPASPRNRASRRLSLRIRDLVEDRLLAPRHRAGIYIPPSTFLCLFADSILLATAPTEPRSRYSHHDQPDIVPSEFPVMSQQPNLQVSEESESQIRPPSLNIHVPTTSIPDNGNSGQFQSTERPRSVMEAPEVNVPHLQDRRATWSSARSWPTIRPSASFLSMNETAGTDAIAPASLLRRSPLQTTTSSVQESLSTQSLASASPLASLSSLFTRTTSNQSSSSTLTPSSMNGPRSPPFLRPGAARLATPSTNASLPNSDVDVEQENHTGRRGRMARVQTRLRRQMDNLLSRGEAEDEHEMDITSILRNMGRLPRPRGADGSSITGEQIADGMAPFTIVGIRRVNPGTEITGEDNLPPYIRELLGSATTEDGRRGSNERRRASLFRGGRRRGVLSFYDRMESPSREQALQMLQRRRPRSLYGAGSLRRNGVVGPDSPDNNLDDEDTDSTDTDEPANRDDPTYIIYLISGILPENHPLLSAPSLFTNNPTYEDMLYIASLLGPGKPPVASESDVASAPGLFVIEVDTDGKLFAVSSETEECISLPSVIEDGIERAERCLVCLSDYEAEEEARKLVRCGHLFHKDCIDQVCHCFFGPFYNH